MALMDDDARRVPMLGRVIWALCLIAAIGLSAWGVLRVTAAKESHDKVMAGLVTERDEAEETYRRSSVSEVHDAAETSRRLDAARTAAGRLAEAENGYQSVSAEGKDSYVREHIDPLFADDVESSDRRWMSMLSVPYTWRDVPCVMIDAYDVPCAWMCEADGKFMGYVTARFDPETGKFFGVRRVRSDLAREYYGSEGSTLGDGTDGTGFSDEAASETVPVTETRPDEAAVVSEPTSGVSDAPVGGTLTEGKVDDGDAFSR